MKKLITIQTSRLTNIVWGNISKFVADINQQKLSESVFNSLSTLQVQIIIDDVVIRDYNELVVTFALYKNSEFDINVEFIKMQEDALRDFSTIIPYIYLNKRHNLSLIINLNSLEIEDANRYYFSLSQFLSSLNAIENIEAANNIRVKLISNRTQKLALQMHDNMSSRFSPLLEINEESKRCYFDTHEGCALLDYINQKVEQVSSVPDSLKVCLREHKYRNTFSEIFIKNFYLNLSYSKIEGSDSINEMLGTYDIFSLLQTYCDNLKELVENIVYHTEEKTGYFYYTFNLIKDVPSEIAALVKHGDYLNRIIEFRVYDFSNYGIIDTYKKNNEQDDRELKDVFDTMSVIMEELNHLDFRYTAHLGLKTFAKTITDYHGYFSVETSSHKRQNKNSLVSYCDGDNGRCNCSIVFGPNIPGTHYYIALPFDPRYMKAERVTNFQMKSFSSKYTRASVPPNEDQISLVNVHINIPSSYQNSSKDDQIRLIKEIGDDIVSSSMNREDVLAIDYTSLPPMIDNNIFWKILSYVQLTRKDHFKRIFVYNARKDLIMAVGRIMKLLVDSRKELWNNSTAVLMLTSDFHLYVLSGETFDTFCAYNNIARLYYPINDQDNLFKFIQFRNSDIQLEEHIKPYDLWVRDESGNTIFESYVSKILDNQIGDTYIGFSLSERLMRIGNKIVLNNFYEADILFQNSFFVDRFSYLLSQIILKQEYKCILIGYGQYSELMMNTLKSMCGNVEGYIIANEINDKIEWNFENGLLDKIKSNPDVYKYVTIVPIGSTTTTNDKLQVKFCQYLNNKLGEHNHSITSSEFVLEMSVIIVRDRQGAVTDIEKSMGWESINTNLKLVKTNYADRKHIIRYLIIKDGYWENLINRYSFPEDYTQEKLINATKNHSLQTQRNLGLPKSIKLTEELYKISKKRLYTLRNFLYFGHIIKFDRHLRYYIDTESFVVSGCKEYQVWLNSNASNDVMLHILVTPKSNVESKFVKDVNKYMFDNAALILYMDLNGGHESFQQHRYNFIKSLEPGGYKIHYVDHSLCTGKNVKTARSFVSAIFGLNKGFDSIIALVNRLPYNLHCELNGYRDKNIINAYLTLLYPVEEQCSFCKRKQHYGGALAQSSSLDSCQRTIKEKLTSIDAKQICKNEGGIAKERDYLRLLCAHNLNYVISSEIDKGRTIIEIIDVVKSIFYSKDRIEQRISYLKVLSSSQFSQYLELKELAHSLAIEELKMVLNRKDFPSFDDFSYLLVLMKILSELESTAIMRLEVIRDIWRLYENIYLKVYSGMAITDNDNIPQDLFSSNTAQRIEDLRPNVDNFKDIYALYIKRLTFIDESKSFWLGELLRTGNELSMDNLYESRTSRTNKIFHLCDGANPDVVKLYKDFVYRLFYDNTTIIRQTLNKFETEVENNSLIRNMFYENNQLRIYDNIAYEDVITKFKYILQNEYYYRNAKDYILQNERPDFMNTLVTLLYVSLFVKHTSTDKANIHNNLSQLLKLLMNIMKADSARIVLSKVSSPDKVYIIESVHSDDIAIADRVKLLPKESYTYKTLMREKHEYPIVVQYGLNDMIEITQGYNAMALITINDPSKGALAINENTHIGSIDFLYKDVSTVNDRINIKENGRLILMLRSQINGYVNKLISRVIFDDWIEKTVGKQNNDMIFKESEHFSNQQVLPAMDLMHKTISELYAKGVLQEKAFILETFVKGYYVLSNNIITYLYRIFTLSEDNSNPNFSTNKIELSEIFDDSFIYLLKEMPKIIFKLGGTLEVNVKTDLNKKVAYHKSIIHSFIIQCIQNSMNKHFPHYDKRTVIEILDDGIVIQNDIPFYKTNKEGLMNAAHYFSIVKKKIKQVNTEEANYTTLTSIQGYFGKKCSYDYIIKEDNMYFVIKFNY